MEEIFVCTCDKEIKFLGEEWDEVSDDLKELIQQMLTKDPKSRPDIETVSTHKWLL